MNVTNKKIELTQKENEIFEREFKAGILCQLYTENLLTHDQFKKAINAVKN